MSKAKFNSSVIARIGALACAFCIFAGSINTAVSAESVAIQVKMEAKDALPGRIDPMLFGNFVELLEDVVPGMWAEMLNDRSFEGVIPAANWSYYDGRPDFCDRTWDTNSTWSLETTNVFNGSKCARLSPSSGERAFISQSGLAVKKGTEYEFSGYFRADASVRVTSLLKALLPDGSWMTLASLDLPKFSTDWKKCNVRLKSRGQTDRVVFELSAKGKGSLWADKLSLMPADNVQGWRADVVREIKESRPSVIRWGGSSCDPGQYRWKDGIGDRDQRTPFLNKVWGRIDPNDVGIDEFCQFCEAVSAEPLICLSFADGPQNAADQVEYCNGDSNTKWGARRAANGHPAPYHVKYWQVGNEISGDDANYLARFGDFIRLIKKADPAARVMTSFPSQALLTRFGPDIFCVCPHHYTPDLGACDRDFNEISKMIDSTAGCGAVKIGVTEWNISGGDWGLGRGRQMTLGAALANARYLHVMMRHADKVKLACRSNLANSYCGATIETDASGVLERPSYLVMQLYAQHAKPVPVQATCADKDLDIVACASDDHNSVCLFCVNTKTKPVAISVQDISRGLMPASLAYSVCDVRAAGQKDIVNSWDAPKRISTVALPTNEVSITLPALSSTVIECRL